MIPVLFVNEFTGEYDKPNPHESGHVRAPGKDSLLIKCLNQYESMLDKYEKWILENTNNNK